jgi:hypothetical protein
MQRSHSGSTNVKIIPIPEVAMAFDMVNTAVRLRQSD